MVHGHNWEVKATIEAAEKYQDIPLDLNINMVEEFGASKKKWHSWIDDHVDHSIMLNEQDVELREVIWKLVPHGRVAVTPGDPTTELCCALFMAKCNAFLQSEHGDHLVCTRVELIETPTNTVIFEGKPHFHIPQGAAYWWNRADTSTNDVTVEQDLL